MSIHHNQALQPEIIISGGQLGADCGALIGAMGLGIGTGGIAPTGFRTEDGPRPELGYLFGLVESKHASYGARTRQNVLLADAVIVVAYDFNSTGTHLTIELARENGKPLFQVPYSPHLDLEPYNLIGDIQHWLSQCRPGILMFAGNRESKARGIEQWTAALVQRLFV